MLPQYIVAASAGWLAASLLKRDAVLGAGLGGLLYGLGGVPELPGPIRIPAVWYRGTIDRLVATWIPTELENGANGSGPIDVTWSEVPDLDPEPAPLPWDLP